MREAEQDDCAMLSPVRMAVVLWKSSTCTVAGDVK